MSLSVAARLREMARSVPLFVFKALGMGPAWWPLALVAPLHPLISRMGRRWILPFPRFHFRTGSTDLVGLVILLADLHEGLMRRVLERVDAVIDGGANAAAFCTILREWAGSRNDLEWIAVELCPENAAMCRRQPVRDHLRVFNQALGPVPGKIRWMRGVNEGTAQLEGVDETDFMKKVLHHEGEWLETEVVPLSSLTGKPALLKLDIEGAEYDLLAVPLPSNIRFMLVEFHLQKRREPAAPASLVPHGHWVKLGRDLYGGESWFWMAEKDPELVRLAELAATS